MRIDYIILGIVIFNSTLLLWFLKTVIAALWLYYQERNYLDLTMAGMFAAKALERAGQIAASYAVYKDALPATTIPLDAYSTFFWRLVTLIILNLACLAYDIIFLRYKPDDA